MAKDGNEAGRFKRSDMKALEEWYMNLGEGGPLDDEAPTSLLTNKWFRVLNVELRDGNVAWSYSREKAGDDVVLPTEVDSLNAVRMVLQFINLRNAEDVVIMDFCQRWGPLEVEVTQDGDWFLESCETWRQQAQLAWTTLKLAMKLSATDPAVVKRTPYTIASYTTGPRICDQCDLREPHNHYQLGDKDDDIPGPPEHWQEVLGAFGSPRRWGTVGTRYDAIMLARQGLAGFLTEMLERVKVRPVVYWFDEPAPWFSLWNYASVRGQIWGRIALALTGGRGIGKCAFGSCTNPVLLTGKQMAADPDNVYCKEHQGRAYFTKKQKEHRALRKKVLKASRAKGGKWRLELECSHVVYKLRGARWAEKYPENVLCPTCGARRAASG